MHPVWLVLAAVAACWESWRWYLQRVWSTPEEAIALIVAIGLTVAARPIASRFPRAGRGWAARAGLQSPVVALLVLYVIAFPFAPPILRAGIAVLALLYALDRTPPPALLVVGLLATPVVPTLQFYLGYPLRILSAAVSVVLLRLHGLAVERQGTYLSWQGELVQFDAPCSGVSMLWAGLLLTAMLAYVYRLRWLHLAAALLACTAVVTVANILRATSLFFLETRQIAGAPAWLHEGSGLAAFIVAGLAMAWLTGRLARDLLPLQAGVMPTEPGQNGYPLLAAPRMSWAARSRAWQASWFGPQSKSWRGVLPPRRAEGAPSARRGGGARFTLMSLVVLSAGAPMLLPAKTSTAPADARFPGFPAIYDGRPLTELPLSAKEVAFAADFPGRIGRFTDGQREIIVRYVLTATRKLHPASDCFRGLGYAVTPIPMRRNAAGQAMSCFEAKGPGGAYRVCEHLDDGIGNSWPDVGAWYWSALFSRGGGGWWSYTVAEGMASQSGSDPSPSRYN